MAYSEENKRMVVEAYMAGSTLRQAGLLVGASAQTVANWTKGKTRVLPSKLHGEERKGEILTLYNGGMGQVDVANRLGLTRDIVSAVIKRHGKMRGASEAALLSAHKFVRRTKTINEGAFDVWTPETAWAYGVLAGDGCIVRYKGKVFGVQVAGDLDVVEKVKAVCGSSHTTVQKGGCHVCTMSSMGLARGLMAHGMTPAKSTTVAPPDVAEGLVRHFVRGYWDADGHVGARVMSVSSVSRAMIDFMADRMLSVFGVRPAITLTKRRKKTHNQHYEVKAYSLNAQSFARYVYEGAEQHMRSDRKYERATVLWDFLR